MAVPGSPVLRYKAGPAARQRLLDGGFTPETIGAIVGPASGPKWLVLVGLDRALFESGFFLGDVRPGRRRLLVGASAGAWRMAALAGPQPLTSYRRLMGGYIEKVFPKKVTPKLVTDTYVPMMAELYSGAAAAHALHHPYVDLAVHTVRVRRPLPTRPNLALMAWLGVAALANAVSPRTLGAFVERVVFHSAPERFEGDVEGRLVQLPAESYRHVMLASASVPTALESVDSPAGAPPGRYLDGGVSDYHLATRYLARDDDRVVLLPHYQERISPGWFDKHLRRAAPPNLVDDVLQIHPDPLWIASLPGGRVPDRKDFYDLAENPDVRLGRWRESVAMSETLGQALLDDLQSGAWAERLEPLA